jgi:hypothetical protein
MLDKNLSEKEKYIEALSNSISRTEFNVLTSAPLNDV